MHAYLQLGTRTWFQDYFAIVLDQYTLSAITYPAFYLELIPIKALT